MRKSCRTVAIAVLAVVSAILFVHLISQSDARGIPRPTVPWVAKWEGSYEYDSYKLIPTADGRELWRFAGNQRVQYSGTILTDQKIIVSSGADNEGFGHDLYIIKTVYRRQYETNGTPMDLFLSTESTIITVTNMVKGKILGAYTNRMDAAGFYERAAPTASIWPKGRQVRMNGSVRIERSTCTFGLANANVVPEMYEFVYNARNPFGESERTVVEFVVAPGAFQVFTPQPSVPGFTEYQFESVYGPKAPRQ